MFALAEKELCNDQSGKHRDARADQSRQQERAVVNEESAGKRKASTPALRSAADRDIQASGKSIDEKNSLIAATLDTARRMGTGLGQLDAKIGKWAGGSPTERAQAIARSVRALQDTVLLGVTTNATSSPAANAGLRTSAATGYSGFFNPANSDSGPRNAPTRELGNPANSGTGIPRSSFYPSVEREPGDATIIRLPIRGQ